MNPVSLVKSQGSEYRDGRFIRGGSYGRLSTGCIEVGRREISEDTVRRFDFNSDLEKTFRLARNFPRRSPVTRSPLPRLPDRKGYVAHRHRLSRQRGPGDLKRGDDSRKTEETPRDGHLPSPQSGRRRRPTDTLETV